MLISLNGRQFFRKLKNFCNQSVLLHPNGAATLKFSPPPVNCSLPIPRRNFTQSVPPIFGLCNGHRLRRALSHFLGAETKLPLLRIQPPPPTFPYPPTLQRPPFCPHFQTPFPFSPTHPPAFNNFL